MRWQSFFVRSLWALCAAGVAGACDTSPRSLQGQADARSLARTYAPVTMPSAQNLPPASEVDEVYAHAAQSALAYLQAHRSARTGLVSATPNWANITLWDVGSLLGAVYSAGELGLITTTERDQWLGDLLRTMRTAPLAGKIAYNRVYTVASASMLGDKDVPT